MDWPGPVTPVQEDILVRERLLHSKHHLYKHTLGHHPFIRRLNHHTHSLIQSPMEAGWTGASCLSTYQVMVFRDVAMQHPRRDEGDREVGGRRPIHDGGPNRWWAINNSARAERLAIVGQGRRRCIQGHALGNRRAVGKHSVHHVSGRRHKGAVLVVIQLALFLAVSSTVCILTEINRREFYPHGLLGKQV